MSRFLVIFFVILLCGTWDTNDKVEQKENITISSESLSQNKNVKVKCYKEGKQKLYKYSVYDNKRKRFYHEEKIYKEPTVKRINKNMIQVGWGAGTGVYIARYFDVQNSRVSEVFITPRDEYNTKIIRFEYNKVVIQDMFDSNDYYEETLPLLDVADANTAIFSAKFINENELLIKYYNKDNKKETKKIVIDK